MAQRDTSTGGIPERYAAEIEARNALTEACPVDVYAYSISPRWSWPWKLQSYYEARPGAADSCDSLLIDSGSRRVGTMHGIIEAVEKTDADAVIPPDPTPKTDAYDDLTPSVHASETASHYWTAIERLPDDCDVLVPIHAPYVDYLDALRSWDPERVQGYRDDPAFDYPKSEREREQYLAGRANYSLTYDLVDAAGGVAVGGLLALDVDERIAALREVRKNVGRDVHVHALGLGTDLRVIKAVRESPGLIDSLDVSTFELAPGNNKLPDRTWTQQRHMMPAGTDVTTVRSQYAVAVATQFAHMLSPELCRDDVLEDAFEELDSQ
ncbi:hypothetical protein ABSL23_15855 (plasmid) [Halobacterium sp. NMX12-1]|uniref:Queuine tRNA-ribosyltransferase n=1 Tax=Halobacterium sp. NMX12-1 TaxID=3166650 RepID=A0AAU8CGY5_9EURY